MYVNTSACQQQPHTHDDAVLYTSRVTARFQICYAVAVINMVCRLDYYSVFIGITVGFFLCMNRRRSAYVWSIHIGLFVATLCIQCIAVLGLPYANCYHSLGKFSLIEVSQTDCKNLCKCTHTYALFTLPKLCRNSTDMSDQRYM